jgi:hypothetical protein
MVGKYVAYEGDIEIMYITDVPGRTQQVSYQHTYCEMHVILICQWVMLIAQFSWGHGTAKLFFSCSSYMK